MWSIISTQSKQNSKIHRPVYQGPRCVRIMKITVGRKFRDTLPYCRNFNFFKVNIRFRILNNKSFQRHVLWKETEVCCNNYWNNFILLYYITILLYIILLYYYITLYNLLEQLYIFVKQPYYQFVLNCLRLLTVQSVFIFPFHLLVCEVFFLVQSSISLCKANQIFRTVVINYHVLLQAFQGIIEEGLN